MGSQQSSLCKNDYTFQDYESLTNMFAGGALQKVVPVNSGSHGNGSPLKRKASFYP